MFPTSIHDKTPVLASIVGLTHIFWVSPSYKQKAETETDLWDSVLIEKSVILDVLGHCVLVNCKTHNTESLLNITFYISRHQWPH